MHRNTFLLIALGLASSALSMNGTAVTVMKGSAGVTGALTAYEINNNAVTASRTLVAQNCKAAGINMAGTHVAFFQVINNQNNICVVAIDGGTPVAIKTVTLLGNLWWTKDGCIYYQESPYEIRKITLSPVTNGFAVADQLVAKLEYEPQMEFVDFSMDGKRIHVKSYGCRENENPCTSASGLKFTDRWACPISADPAVLVGPSSPGALYANAKLGGCGCGISPSGSELANLGGSGHEAICFQSWDDAAAGNGPQCFTFAADMKSWTPDHPGVGGVYNGWSANSEKWIVSHVGCQDRFEAGGSGQYAINWREQKCIDITKSCGNGKYAMRGDLWVSSQADVNSDLWTFVQNREQEKTYWDNLFAGTKQVVGTSRRPASRAGPGVNVRLLPSGRTIVDAPGLDAGMVSIFDTRGRLLTSQRIVGGTIDLDLRPFAGASCFLRVEAGEWFGTVRIAPAARQRRR